MKTLHYHACLRNRWLAQTSPLAQDGRASRAKKAAPAAKKAAAAARRICLKPNTLRARAPEVYKVKFTTTKGDVIIQVTRAWAPHGRRSFLQSGEERLL